MDYHFNEMITRPRESSVKWERAEKEEICMWIADMDLMTPKFVLKGIEDRMKHPIFGYFTLPQSYYTSIINWHKKHHKAEGLKEEHIGYHNSVLGGVSSFLRAYSKKKDYILVHTPTYKGFHATISDLERTLLPSPLIEDEKGRLVMDFKDMEEKIKTYHPPVLIFCSPHNPTGRVWEKEEIHQLIELCDAYGVKIISDEIWADFAREGYTHIPTQQVSQKGKKLTYGLYSPTKTFNIAGLIGGYSICYNPEMAERVEKKSKQTHYNTPNVLSTAGTIAAYEEGEDWVIQLKAYLEENIQWAEAYIQEKNKKLKVIKGESTYLLWVDCREISKKGEVLLQACKEQGVIPDNGLEFLQEGYLRFNLACPKERCQEGVKRFLSAMEMGE